MTYFPSTGQWRAVDAEDHLQRGLVDSQARQRFSLVNVADRIADFDAIESDHGHDVASLGLGDVLASEVVERMQRGDLAGRFAIASLHQCDLLPPDNAPRDDPPDRDPAHVVGPIERRDQHLQGP